MLWVYHFPRESPKRSVCITSPEAKLIQILYLTYGVGYTKQQPAAIPPQGATLLHMHLEIQGPILLVVQSHDTSYIGQYILYFMHLAHTTSHQLLLHYTVPS